MPAILKMEALKTAFFSLMISMHHDYRTNERPQRQAGFAKEVSLTSIDAL